MGKGGKTRHKTHKDNMEKCCNSHTGVKTAIEGKGWETQLEKTMRHRCPANTVSRTDLTKIKQEAYNIKQEAYNIGEKMSQHRGKCLFFCKNF